MPSRLRESEEWCRSAEARALAAELDAERSAPGYVPPPPPAWLDPGPDPFDMGYTWMLPEQTDAATAGEGAHPISEPISTVNPPGRQGTPGTAAELVPVTTREAGSGHPDTENTKRKRGRYVAYTAIATAAAVAIVGVGFVTGQKTKNEPTIGRLTASVEPRRLGHLGAAEDNPHFPRNAVGAYRVDVRRLTLVVRAPRVGSATVIIVSDSGRRTVEVHPIASPNADTPIEVEVPKERVAVFVVTAPESVVDIVQDLDARDVTQIQSVLPDRLLARFPWYTLEEVTLVRADAPQPKE